MAAMKAKLIYKTQILIKPEDQNLVQKLSRPFYTEEILGKLSLDQAQALKEVSDKTPRQDLLAKNIAEVMVPELLKLQTEKQQIELAISVARESFEYGFVDRFTSDKGYETQIFYDLLDNCIKRGEQHAKEDEIARRVAALTENPSQLPTRDVHMSD